MGEEGEIERRDMEEIRNGRRGWREWGGGA